MDILVMIGDGDMILMLKKLSNRTALTAFNAFYIRWISNFDAETFVYVYFGSNIFSKIMKLHEV